MQLHLCCKTSFKVFILLHVLRHLERVPKHNTQKNKRVPATKLQTQQGPFGAADTQGHTASVPANATVGAYLQAHVRCVTRTVPAAFCHS